MKVVMHFQQNFAYGQLSFNCTWNWDVETPLTSTTAIEVFGT